MHRVLALPDYNQDGVIAASTDQGITTLNEAVRNAGVNLVELPASCVLGIPEPVLRQNSGDSFVFSQVARLSDIYLIVISCCAGRDKSNRSVFLTEIVILNENELDNFNFLDFVNEPPSCEGLGNDIGNYLAKMRKNASSDVSNLIGIARQHPRYSHIASTEMVGMRYQPDWPKKPLSRHVPKSWLIGTLVLAAIAAAGYEVALTCQIQQVGRLSF